MKNTVEKAALVVANAAMKEAKNALLDYVDKLEKQGGFMFYGKTVIRQLDISIKIADEIIGD